MPKKDITYDFPYAERHSYSVFPASDIGIYAEAKSGIYAWYMRVLSNTQTVEGLTAFGALFSTRELTLNATSFLNESYIGKLRRNPPFANRSPELSSLITSASTIFCPPIYIGISNDISIRLKAHYKSLSETLSNPSTSTQTPVDNGDDPEDSEEESSKFGQRLGRVLRQQGIVDTNSLFVKVIYQDSLNRDELRCSEHFVNRTFLPLYGKR